MAGSHGSQVVWEGSLLVQRDCFHGFADLGFQVFELLRDILFGDVLGGGASETFEFKESSSFGEMESLTFL